MPDEMSPEERRDLLTQLLAGLPVPHGPMPPDRWAHLPEYQREWLAGKSKAELDRLDKLLALDPKRLEILINLDEEDVEDLREAVRFARSLRTTGRFVRMLVLTILGIVTGMMAFKEQFGTLFRWLTGTKG